MPHSAAATVVHASWALRPRSEAMAACQIRRAYTHEVVLTEARGCMPRRSSGEQPRETYRSSLCVGLEPSKLALQP